MAVFTLQAVPWLALLALWGVVAVALMLGSLVLRLVALAASVASVLVESVVLFGFIAIGKARPLTPEEQAAPTKVA